MLVFQHLLIYSLLGASYTPTERDPCCQRCTQWDEECKEGYKAEPTQQIKKCKNSIYKDKALVISATPNNLHKHFSKFS